MEITGLNQRTGGCFPDCVANLLRFAETLMKTRPNLKRIRISAFFFCSTVERIIVYGDAVV